ncbi:hypothetical protein, partial [Klebsiella pneumoniae]
LGSTFGAKAGLKQIHNSIKQKEKIQWHSQSAPFCAPTFIMINFCSNNWFIRKKIKNLIFGLDPFLGSKPEQKKTFFWKNCSHCSPRLFIYNIHKVTL